jgi:hypothetical protein
MKFTNTSAYHTATLRRIFTVTIRALSAELIHAEGRPWDFNIIAEEGRVLLRWAWMEKTSISLQRVATLRLVIPKLRGSEFITLLRQQHGGLNPDFGKAVEHGALKSEEVAFAAQEVAYEHFRVYGHRVLTLHPAVYRALKSAKVPQYVPLRVRKPPKEEVPRDIVALRYDRVLAAETRWKTKFKLAETKLKKLRLKRRHYEKQLAKRNTTKEN